MVSHVSDEIKKNKVWKIIVKLWKQTFTGFPITIIAMKLVVKNSIDIDYSWGFIKSNQIKLFRYRYLGSFRLITNKKHGINDCQ